MLSDRNESTVKPIAAAIAESGVAWSVSTTSS